MYSKYQQQTTVRQSNFELLRIVAILLILTMHVWSQIGIYEAETAVRVSTLNRWITVIINAIGNTGVSCFILISGYFGIKCKSDKFLHIVILTTFYALLLCLCFHAMGIDMGEKGYMTALFSVPLYQDWFIACYLFLMMVAQYIDILVRNLTRKDFRWMLIVLFLFLSFVPTLFLHKDSSILIGGGKCLIYSIFLYLLGRYIHLYETRFYFSRKMLFAVLIVCQILIVVGNGFAMEMKGTYVGVLSKDFSPLILLSSVSIFLLFKSISIKSVVVNSIAKSVLGIYLLDNLYRIVDEKVVHLSHYSSSELAIVMLLFEVCICFAICLVVDKLRTVILKGIENAFIASLLRLYRSVKGYASRTITIL